VTNILNMGTASISVRSLKVSEDNPTLSRRRKRLNVLPNDVAFLLACRIPETARKLKEDAPEACTACSKRVLDSIRLRRIAAPIVSVNAAAHYSGEVARANAPTEMSTVPVHRPPSRLFRPACSHRASHASWRCYPPGAPPIL